MTIIVPLESKVRKHSAIFIGNSVDPGMAFALLRGLFPMEKDMTEQRKNDSKDISNIERDTYGLFRK